MLIGGVRCGRVWVRFFLALVVFFFRFFLRGVVFFRIFVAVFQFFLWLLSSSLRLLPWLLPLAFRLCDLCSLVSWSSDPRVAGLLSRPAWPGRVRPSRVPLSGVASALGRWLGRWLLWLLVPGVCRCCLAGLPLLASSFLCFLSFF